jgi:quercetin dioxygenase-like cupin family protein
MAESEVPAPTVSPASASASASVSLVHAAERTPSVDSPGGSVRPLVRGERAMLPVEYDGAPREFHEYFRHEGEEFVYVVRGLIEIDIEGETRVAAAGDSVYYAGGLRHRWRGLGGERVRLVVIQQNPRRHEGES